MTGAYQNAAHFRDFPPRFRVEGRCYQSLRGILVYFIYRKDIGAETELAQRLRVNEKREKISQTHIFNYDTSNIMGNKHDMSFLEKKGAISHGTDSW